MAVTPEQPSQAIHEKINRQNKAIDEIRRHTGAALVAIAVKQQDSHEEGRLISVGLIPPGEYFGFSNTRQSVVIPTTDRPIECPSRSVPTPKPRIVIPRDMFKIAEISLGQQPASNCMWTECRNPIDLASELDVLVQQAMAQGHLVA